MIMYDYEDNQLSYTIECAIDELNRELDTFNHIYEKTINNSALNESVIYNQSMILNEGIKDAITEFIKKVVAAVSKAWNNFKLLNNSKTKELIKNNQDKLNSDFKMYFPQKFQIPEIKIWDNLNESVKIKDFSNYETWKQQNIMGTTESFIKSQYPDLVQGDKNLVQVMHDKCFRNVKENEAAGKELVVAYADFINNYEAQKNKIGEDIDNLNASNKNIEAKLNQIVSEANYYIGYDIFDLLTEGDQTRAQISIQNNKQSLQQQNNQQSIDNQYNKNKNKFRSADPNDRANDDNKKKLAQDRKNIVIYYKASTQVFSAKLKTCRQIETACEKIVNNFIKLQLKGNKKNKTENKTQTTNQQQGSTTIQK